MAFADSVADLEAIRDDAKASLETAEAQLDEIINGMFFFDDYDGAAEVYRWFASGTEPEAIEVTGPRPELVIPNFDSSYLDDFDPYTIFQTAAYDSEFLEDMEQNCRQIFAGNIPGFTQASVEALFQWRQEQDQRDLQVELDEAVVQFNTRRGFPIPVDHTAHKQNEILRRYSYQQNDRTRETTTVQAEALIKAFEVAMASGINIEEIRAKMYTAIMDGVVAKLRAQVEVYQATVAGLVAEFEGQIRLIAMDVDVAKTNGELNIAYWRSIIQKVLGLKQNQLGIVNREYDEVRDQSQIRANAAETIAKNWGDIYSTAATNVQSIATETTGA